MEKRILIALIFGLLQCLPTLASPQPQPQRQRGLLHMQLHPVKDPAATKRAPVHAKILKQINSVNDDGSYTFGYEADDGSFKVETRSKDGVVKGKYGFIDPNGQLKTVEYTAGERSPSTGRRDSKESDLSMASATDSKTTVSRAPPPKNDESSSNSENSEESEEENDVGTFNSFRPGGFGGQDTPPLQNQYTRQAPGGLGGQYFREVNPGSTSVGVGAGAGGAGSGEQDYRGVRPGAGLQGLRQGVNGANPGLQFQRQQFADERQFDGRQPQFGQFGGQQFNPQQFGQPGAGAGAAGGRPGLGNPQLAQGQGFGGPQQQQQQRPFLFPQQGPFIGSPGQFPGQQGFGGPGAGGNPQFQQQQFGPQQSFRQPFGLGGPQTSPQGGNSFNARPGQGQQPQQFNDGFNDPQQFAGQGFGGFDGQPEFDVINGPFGVGAGGVNALNQFGIQQQQQNPLLSNQLGGGGFNGGLNGGVGAGNRNPGGGGVRINPNGDSGLRPRPANVGAANSQEYVPSVELDGFSEDADQDGFVDRFPNSGEQSDKKAAQTEEKTPAVKTPDGRQVEEQPVQYRPQILGPQQQRPQQGIQPGFQQRPQFPNQFGVVSPSPYDDDRLSQLYLQLGQQNRFGGPQFIGGGGPQSQFQGGIGGNPQFLGGGQPQFFNPNFQGGQQQFLGGPQGPGGFPQQQSVAGLQNQQSQQQQLNPGQGQAIPGRTPAGPNAVGVGPATGLEQFQTLNDGANIQPQYIPQILTGPAGQAQFAQAPNYQTGAGFGGGPGIGGPGFQAYPGFNPYDSPYASPFGFGGGGGPQQFQQQQFINPQQLQQQQQFLGGQSPQRGPQSLLGQQPQQQQQSQLQSQQPQSQQLLGQGSQQLSLGGIVNGGGGGGERRERDDGSNEDKKTN